MTYSYEANLPRSPNIIHSVFIEHLLCATKCTKHAYYIYEDDTQVCYQESYKLVGGERIQKISKTNK